LLAVCRDCYLGERRIRRLVSRELKALKYDYKHLCRRRHGCGHLIEESHNQYRTNMMACRRACSLMVHPHMPDSNVQLLRARQGGT
jgi:hypothetical protein